MNVKLYNRLSVQLILVISLVLITTFAFQALYTVKKLKEDFTNSLSQNAYNISDIIKKSTRYSMLLNRRNDVYHIINTIATESGVEKIRIYNKQGQIIFSTDSTEVLKNVDMTEEACIACHTQGKRVVNLPVSNKIRIFVNTSNERMMGLINPIYNEPDCYNSDCHAHEPNVKMLGVLDVVMSMDKIDKVIQANISRIIYYSIIITIIISALIWLSISLLVNRPIKKLVKGIDEVGKGNLKYKIEVKTENELGEMANQFNDMSLKLDSAYKEIQEWSNTLNEKVTEKTEELKKIYDQIIQIEKLASLGKLSATVAHELNNPLEGILTYSKLIAKILAKQQKDNEFEKLLMYLNFISDESAHCGRIVKDLLLFSHRGEEEFQIVEIHDIIDRCVMLINHHLEMNNISLIKEIPEEEIKIKGDSQKIQQAFISLLMNAIEAMPNGGKLQVRVEKDSEKLYTRFIDEGYGISEKDVPHIFEPFYTTKQEVKGTGLGLTVAYGIIERHKGKLEIENTSLKGTTMKITLPLYKNNNRD